MALLQSSIPPPSSVSYGFTYDVFLSFRGSDTRYGFTGNLYKALCKKGICTFFDDRELQGGDEITPSLCKTIEESRIFIPVLSINYASSSFCLDELVHIIHCFKESGRLVLPVFYGVEPSHVRHQDGSFGKALAEHIERFKNNKDGMESLQKWKSALTQTANFSGYYFNPRNGYEYEFIAKIVKYVSKKIIGVPSYGADYPVGLESRVLKVNSFVDFRSNGEVPTHSPIYFLSSHCLLTSFLFSTLVTMLQSSISSSSYSYGLTYNVFLSFRGRDTRYGFTGNLYRALCDKGIHTYIDDKELQGGDEIKSSLFKAIEESRIFIPVLSINYASSSFCLDELSHIIDRFKESGRLVLPIFYDVEPYHVRDQDGSYGKALAEHIEKFQSNKDNMERLHEWKTALTQTANFSGHHFNPRNGYEYECIEKIVKYVSNKINRVPLYVTDYPIGLNSRVLKVNSFVDVGSSGVVHMLGIYGIGGVGKTTLARAVYNSIADQFDGLCFLHDIRENSVRHGLKHLQGMLLSKLVELEVKLGDVNEGIQIIKQSLHRKKVLLILDDVHELKQLQVLAGGLDWFGPGSRVIVTTRDKQLLANHGIERAYELEKLNDKEALELLRWKSFKNNNVNSDFEGVLRCAVTYASGLPLALEVIGSNLFGKNIGEWKSALDQYERIPIKNIQQALKVSFDALEEEEKSVFLDISCCFKGHGLKTIEDILHSHYGFCVKHQIRVLLEKSLIKINQCHLSNPNVVILHNLIEKMGKEIVLQECQTQCVP